MTHALRAAALTFHKNPFISPVEECYRYESDALLLIEEGKIKAFGPANSLLQSLPEGCTVTHYPDSLILPGFIDCHVHYPQTEMIAAYGEQLIDWLNKYTFVTEQKFSDKEYGRAVASVFLDESLRNGTTTSMVFCTVFPESVEAFFEEAAARQMRMIAGKVLMDRNAPEPLLDTPQLGYDQSKALIASWHGRGRQLYSITPRFAPTSSPEQLELAASLWKEHPGTYLHTHLSENQGECNWVKELFPARKDYLDVYDHYGLVGPRSMLAHGIHISEDEQKRCKERGASIAHCPTSNMFLGSGHFQTQQCCCSGQKVGMGSDLGAGTSFSPLQTLNEAYKSAQLQGYSLSPWHAYYLATRGGAEALHLQDKVGSISEGMEADLVVLDLHSTPLIRYRMEHCSSLEESLFVQMMLGDDRAVRATYVAGALAHDRDH